ncbi:DUF2092 domain-containing protein [Flavobacterium nackdongense]|uniref:DUF2092 domain-containing protein n=1 Tax=Flavobacterium nackdongense TaxID=2547394 RepID=A0A4P6YAR0_9FLAO|nr:DUF2092 domain-containing protein [Flavobacterium nackdongense]QBN17727.1 DUF2092 domain-containing protein [Flavobacterium nackdongense]
MKKQILLLGLSLISLVSVAQPAKCDSVAVLLMDRMSDFIGELQSCSYKLNVGEDFSGEDNFMLKKFSEDLVYMVGPDKMLVSKKGSKGQQSYLYNGTQLAYYSHDENNFGIIDAPDNIIETIEKVNSDYDIEFPAADFFYPAFTDDLIENSSQIKYIGKSMVNDTECFQLLAIGTDFDFQFWISNDAFNLPMKFVYVYKNKKGSPQYEGTFSEWKINPVFPDSMFNFLPPPQAIQIRIASKSLN